MRHLSHPLAIRPHSLSPERAGGGSEAESLSSRLARGTRDRRPRAPRVCIMGPRATSDTLPTQYPPGCGGSPASLPASCDPPLPQAVPLQVSCSRGSVRTRSNNARGAPDRLPYSLFAERRGAPGPSTTSSRASRLRLVRTHRGASLESSRIFTRGALPVSPSSAPPIALPRSRWVTPRPRERRL
jgi:hypothetical protein